MALNTRYWHHRESAASGHVQGWIFFHPCLKISHAMESDVRVYLSACRYQVRNSAVELKCYAGASISKMYPCYKEHAEEEKIAFLQKGESMAELCFTSFMDQRSTKGHVIAAHIRVVRNLPSKYSLTQQNMKTKQNKPTTNTESKRQSLHPVLLGQTPNIT